MVGVIGDQHDRDVGNRGVGFDLPKDVDAICVVAIELAIDEYEVDRLLAEGFQCIFRAVGLNDFCAKSAGHQRADRGVIWDTVADVENSLGHGFRETASGSFTDCD